MEHFQTFSHPSLAHSFHHNQGGCAPFVLSLATRHSALATASPNPLESALSIPRRMRILPALSAAEGSEHRESKALSQVPSSSSRSATQFHDVIPLECAFTSKHRVLPGFGRSCPSVTSLKSALTKAVFITPLECALTKNRGGGAVSPSHFSFARHSTLATFPNKEVPVSRS